MDKTTDTEFLTTREEATELANSMRGRFLISQALFIAQDVLNDKEPPNATHMRIIMTHLFPLFPMLARASSEAGGIDALEECIASMKMVFSGGNDTGNLGNNGEPVVVHNEDEPLPIPEEEEEEEVSNG